MAKGEVKKETNKEKQAVSKVKNVTDKKEKGDTKKVEPSKKATAKKDSKKTTKNVAKSTKESASKTVKKKVTKKTATTEKTSSKTKSEIMKKTAKPMLAEYYDLPYRYNQTIVKILAQTPTTLFVYWDISDNDRDALIAKHGENFFYETKPVLIVHNITHNYSFEVDINDFANSWYIRTQEPNCDYIIELGRKYFSNHGEYIFINSSNDIVSPNDHILFENINLGNVLFKNVKTNTLSSKDFGSLRFINNMDKLYGNIYDVYSALYSDDLLNELTNPSSGEFYLKK